MLNRRSFLRRVGILLAQVPWIGRFFTYGIPRMQPVHNHLLNLRKLYSDKR